MNGSDVAFQAPFFVTWTLPALVPAVTEALDGKKIGLIVTCVVVDRLGNAMLAALICAVAEAPGLVGGVYQPLLSMLPGPEVTDHCTLWLLTPVTVAVNCTAGSP